MALLTRDPEHAVATGIRGLGLTKVTISPAVFGAWQSVAGPQVAADEPITTSKETNE